MLTNGDRSDEPHPLEAQLAAEWNAGQLATQHLADVLSRITAAWRQDRARIAELEARIVEMEAGLPQPAAVKPVTHPNGIQDAVAT